MRSVHSLSSRTGPVPHRPEIAMPQPTAPTDLLARLTGTRVDPDRFEQLLAAYAPVFEEIARLRELDLHDVHPAVLFDPTAAYRSPR